MSNVTNIVLIGMPGSGKSTLGKRLARRRGLQFVDTDTLIERYENKPIQSIVDRRGVRYLTELEAQIVSSLDLTNSVIATGGSAVYSRTAMAHLSQSSVLVYLRISLATMMRRVDTGLNRGLAKMPGHTLPRLYQERLPLYQNVADIICDNDWPLSAVRFDNLCAQLDQFSRA